MQSLVRQYPENPHLFELRKAPLQDVLDTIHQARYDSLRHGSSTQPQRTRQVRGLYLASYPDARRNNAHGLGDHRPSARAVEAETIAAAGNDALIEEADACCVGVLFGPLVAELGTSIPERILVNGDVVWWKDDQKSRFGISLEALKEKKGGERAWKGAQTGFEKAESFLQMHKLEDGPFALGSRPSYADFVLLAFVEMMQRIMSGRDFDRFLSQAEGFKKFYEAGKPWCETK